MDKALGVIGLIAVAVVVFVLSIDDQTAPLTTLSGKVSRQRIEAKAIAQANDPASQSPKSKDVAGDPASAQPAAGADDVLGNEIVPDPESQLRTERELVAELTDKLAAVQQDSVAQNAELNAKVDQAKRGSAAQVADLTAKLEVAQHGSAAENREFNNEVG